MSTAAACERLFAVMDNQPIRRPPEPLDPYEVLASQESALRGPLLDLAPVPPPLQPQT